MVTIHPPPVRELVEKIRTTLEWEQWYRERMFPDQPGLRAHKVREIEGALAALEQLEEKLMEEGDEVTGSKKHRKRVEECRASSCRYSDQCRIHWGRECRQQGGRKIPRIGNRWQEDQEDIA